MGVVEAVVQIFTDDRVTSAAIRLYGVLKSDPGLSRDELARAINKSVRRVDESLDLLVALGYVEVNEKRSMGQSTVSYTFPTDIPMPPQKASC